MKLLPRVTQPPSHPRRRRHRPLPAGGVAGYRLYAPCLRWEFAFSCAFCLLHEADFVWDAHYGGRGPFEIEHRVPRSVQPQSTNLYRNVYYICRPCNAARRSHPVRTPKGRLLDPCATGWGRRFRMKELRLEPIDPTDRDAARTEKVYDINSIDKVTRRKKRIRALEEAIATLKETPELIAAFQARWERERQPMDLAAAERFTADLEHAIAVLESYRAQPQETSAPCRCPRRARQFLPRWLAQQSPEVPLEPRAAQAT